MHATDDIMVKHSSCTLMDDEEESGVYRACDVTCLQHASPATLLTKVQSVTLSQPPGLWQFVLA